MVKGKRSGHLVDQRAHNTTKATLKGKRVQTMTHTTAEICMDGRSAFEALESLAGMPDPRAL